MSDFNTSNRLAGIEWIRLAASLGIVWFHIHAPGAFIGYGGLPLFMIISVAFSANYGKKKTFKQIVKSRFNRMAVPWIFWSVIYAAAKIGQAVHESRPISSEFSGPMCLYGPSVHLWYLPFGMIITIIVGACSVKKLFPIKKKMNTFLGAVLVVLLLPICSYGLRNVQTVPFSQWLFILPAVGAGVLVASLPVGHRNDIPEIIGLFGALITGVVITLSLGFQELAVPYVTAFIACGVVWILPWKTGLKSIWLGQLAFGIYLIHPLVTSMICILSPVILEGVPLAIAIFIISLCLTCVLKVTPLKRFV